MRHAICKQIEWRLVIVSFGFCDHLFKSLKIDKIPVRWLHRRETESNQVSLTQLKLIYKFSIIDVELFNFLYIANYITMPLLYHSLWEFHSSLNRWSLSWVSASKFPHISRSLLSILDDLKAVVCMVSILIFNSSSRFPKTLWTLPSSTTAIGITVKLMFQSFFQLSSKIQAVAYPSFFHFHNGIRCISKVHYQTSSFLLVT